VAEPLIDRAFLEKLERLTIRWRKSFPGLVGGHNLSRFPGPGQEFLDHRHFHQGDDLRGVNWRAYMRLEKMFLKMFRIEPRVPARLLLDKSLSMTAYGGVKFQYARRLAAAFAYIGLVRLDTIHLACFSEHLGDPFPCVGGRHRIGRVSDFLTAQETQGASDFLRVSREFSDRYSQRGLVVIISDFLSDEDCSRPLDYMAEMGHELFLVQIHAPEERTPPWEGQLELKDAETGASVELDFDAEARDRYEAAFDEYSGTLQKLALRHGGRYVRLSTATPIEDAIFGEVHRAQGVS
jgi:uncharacterized protein (DUF58 family)